MAVSASHIPCSLLQKAQKWVHGTARLNTHIYTDIGNGGSNGGGSTGSSNGTPTPVVTGWTTGVEGELADDVYEMWGWQNPACVAERS